MSGHLASCASRCRFVSLVAIVFLAGLALPGAAGASHFRFGHLTWKKAPGQADTVEITFLAAFRRSAYTSCVNPATGGSVGCTGAGGRPGVGDVIFEGVGATRITSFGDGSAATPILLFEVFSIDIRADWLLGRAVDPQDPTLPFIRHAYTSSEPFVVESTGCCRIGSSGVTRHLNNPDQPYKVSTVVNLDFGAAPVGILPPIVDCPAVDNDGDGIYGVTCVFTVGAVDPNNEPPRDAVLNWCKASPEDMGGPDLVQPEEVTLDPGSGRYTLRTSAELDPSLDTLLSTQVSLRVEGTGCDDNPSRPAAAIDFMIRLVPVADDSGDFLSVPMRWCYLDGTPSLEDPASVGAADADGALLDRLVRLNEEGILSQPEGSRLLFVSAARPTGSDPRPRFPIIVGPSPEPDQPDCPPSAENNRGNLPVRGEGRANLLRQLGNACRFAWRDRNPSSDGVIGLNINRFVSETLKPEDCQRQPSNSLLGYALQPFRFGDVGVQLHRGMFEVIDAAWLLPGREDRDLPDPTPAEEDPRERWEAHETCHNLGLDHRCDVCGDTGCTEPPNDQCGSGPPPSCTGCDDTYTPNLMRSSISPRIPAQTAELEPDQQARIRSQASLYPGTVEGELPEFLKQAAAGARGGTLADQLDDTAASDVDLDLVSLVEDGVRGIVQLSAWVFGDLPTADSDRTFYFAVDLDDDVDSGAFAGDIGAPTSAGGFELLGRLDLQLRDQTVETLAQAWTVEDGVVTPLPDGSVSSRADVRFESSEVPVAAEEIPLGQLVHLEISQNVLAGAAPRVRLFVLHEDPFRGLVDEVSGSVFLTPDPLPRCRVDPSTSVPGQTVAVTARDLPASTAADLYLGTERVGEVFTDADGTVVASVDVPPESRVGLRMLSVRLPGSAVAAMCPLSLPVPGFDVPPSPARGTTFTVQAGKSLEIPVQASDGRRSGLVTLSLLNPPAGSQLVTSGAGNPATGTFTWTPAPGQGGSVSLVFTATNERGFSALPLSITVSVVSGTDTQPPELNVMVDPAVLWPPDHKLVRLDVAAAAVDDQDPSPTVELVSVTSSEPDDAPGGGDGHTTGDVVVEDDGTILLRAERDANGPGRVYTLTYRATDAAGNSTEASAEVSVPHDQGK